MDAETLHGLMGSDELELIYLHLHSLPNLRLIGERMPTHTVEDTAPAVDATAPEEAVPAADADEAPTKH